MEIYLEKEMPEDLETLDERDDLAWIPAHQLDKLETKLRKMNKKAVKLDVNIVSYNILAKDERKVLTRAAAEKQEMAYRAMSNYTPRETDYFVCDFYLIKVEGVAPKLAGWSFVARIEHPAEDVNFTFLVPGETIPEHYRSAGRVCEHCNKMRARKDTFVVKNVESGEFKQVGSTCIADFLGGVTPEHALALCRFLYDFASWRDNFGDLSHLDAWDRGYSRIDLETLLIYVHACIKTNGWVSRGVAREFSKSATADDAMSVIWFKTRGPGSGRKPPFWEEDVLQNVTDGDEELAKTVIAWALEINPNTDNEYFYNLYANAKLGFATHKSLGLAASTVIAYLKAMEREAEYKREREKKSNEWVGIEKQRDEFEITVVATRHLEGDWGATHLYRMEDMSGNSIVWFNSGRTRLEDGKAYTIKATVKRHDSYKGRKQTVVNRATVMEEK
jgi:hypothetical protein